MHQFEYFSALAAFWFRNEDDCPSTLAQETPRDSDWLPGIRKAVQRISAMTRFSEEA